MLQSDTNYIPIFDETEQLSVTQHTVLINGQMGRISQQCYCLIWSELKYTKIKTYSLRPNKCKFKLVT